MTVPIHDRKRQVIPRWRTAVSTALLGELGSAANLPTLPLNVGDSLVERIKEWKERGGAAVASDLLSSAIVVGPVPPEAVEAARFVLGPGANTTSAAQFLARRILGGAPPEPFTEELRTPIKSRREIAQRRIRELRWRLGEYPRNALAWV